MSNSSIWPIDRFLSGTTTPGQSGPKINGKKGVLHIPQSSRITRASKSDCLMSYPGYSLEVPLSWDAVSVFYSPSQLENFMCEYVWMYVSIYIYIYIYIYEGPSRSFQSFFVWALLLIVHTWNFSPLRSNPFWIQCTCCTVPITSGRPHGSPLVWVCQWPSSQPLSFPQLSHNDRL